MKSFTAAIDDMLQAAALSEQQEKEGQVEVGRDQAESFSVQEEAQFQLALTYNDLAVQCFGRDLYAEATLLLNKAIGAEKGEAGLYLNRGGGL